MTHRPSPAKPHRWCGQAHTFNTVAAAGCVVAEVARNPLLILAFVPGFVLVIMLNRLIHGRRIADIVAADLAAEAQVHAGQAVYYTIRRFANIAIVCDLVVTAILVRYMWDITTGAAADIGFGLPSLATAVTVAAVTVLFATSIWSHKNGVAPERRVAR